MGSVGIKVSKIHFHLIKSLCSRGKFGSLNFKFEVALMDCHCCVWLAIYHLILVQIWLFASRLGEIE